MRAVETPVAGVPVQGVCRNLHKSTRDVLAVPCQQQVPTQHRLPNTNTRFQGAVKYGNISGIRLKCQNVLYFRHTLLFLRANTVLFQESSTIAVAMLI